MNKPAVFGLLLSLTIGLLGTGCTTDSYPKTEAAIKNGFYFADEFGCDEFDALAKEHLLPEKEPGTNRSLPPGPITITPGQHIGPIAANTSHLKLLQQFGPDNVTIGPVYLYEGQCELGTLLFENDPKRKLEIHWDDKKHLNAISSARIFAQPNEQNDTPSFTPSDWQLPEGITIGTPLATLEKINGRPFEVTGFGWDYGGYVANWKGGRMQQLIGNSLIRLIPGDEEAYSNIDSENQPVGEGQFPSDTPEMKALKPEIWQIIVTPDKTP